MRKATPKDTGNLAYNSLHSYVTKTGLRFTYRGSTAGYGKILNQTLYRKVKTGNHTRYKKNKHFGWHSRASSNAVAIAAREFNPKAKGFRLYNNRQISNKEITDDLVKSFPYSDNLIKGLRQMQAEKVLNVQNKWKTNSAAQAFAKSGQV